MRVAGGLRQVLLNPLSAVGVPHQQQFRLTSPNDPTESHLQDGVEIKQI
jgi:hypothetical protein